MKSLLPVRLLYFAAAAYDGLLGLAFLIDAPRVYAWADITPPNHWGYIHFAAGLLAIFGLMFLMIALRPAANRNLVLYGILLKVCYVATVAWHHFHGGVPAMWIYFAVADAVFALLFAWSLVTLRKLAQQGA
jgi:predicted tellurium resistance membrane protein TerC